MLGLDGKEKLPGGRGLSRGPWGMGRIQYGQKEVLLAKLRMAPHEWRQERARWHLRRYIQRHCYGGGRGGGIDSKVRRIRWVKPGSMEEARLSPLCLMDGGVGLGVICILRRVGGDRGCKRKK